MILTIALGIVAGAVLLILASVAFYVVFWLLAAPFIGFGLLVRWCGRNHRR